MTRTLTVKAWLDNILSSASSSDVASIAPLTPPLTEIETEINTDSNTANGHALNPIWTPSDIPSQFQHCGKRKRRLELEQPRSLELNQQQCLEFAHNPNKRPRIEPISQLTRLNLRRATVETIFQTPVYTQQPSPLTQSPQTPAKSNTNSSSASLKLPNNLHNVRASLVESGMRINDSMAWDACPAEFKTKIMNIVTRDRNSIMANGSKGKIRRLIEENYTQNEATFSGKVVTKVIKESRDVPTKKRSLDDEVVYTAQDYDDDGLHWIQTNRFIKNALPGYSKATEKAMGLNDPQPDWTFGLKQGPNPDPKNRRLPRKVASLLGVCPGMHHPFLVIETKSAEEGIGLAENQAIRDGSTIVNARRQLNYMAQERAANVQHLPATSSGPDEHSFAFSCCWNPDLAKIFVHWCQMAPDGTEVFHTNRVADYVMSREEEIAKLRRDLHNIMDWGVLTNRQAAEEVVAKIRAKVTSGTAEPVDTSSTASSC